MTTCSSVNTLLLHNGMLEHYPCVRNAGHHDGCVDAEGRTWVRLGELMRQRRQGPHIRKARR